MILLDITQNVYQRGRRQKRVRCMPISRQAGIYRAHTATRQSSCTTCDSIAWFHNLVICTIKRMSKVSLIRSYYTTVVMLVANFLIAAGHLCKTNSLNFWKTRTIALAKKSLPDHLRGPDQIRRWHRRQVCFVASHDDYDFNGLQINCYV